MKKKDVLERVLDLLSKIDTAEAQQLYQDVGVMCDEIEVGARRDLLKKATKIHNRIHLSDKFTTKQKGIISTFLKELKELQQ